MSLAFPFSRRLLLLAIVVATATALALIVALARQRFGPSTSLGTSAQVTQLGFCCLPNRNQCIMAYLELCRGAGGMHFGDSTTCQAFCNRGGGGGGAGGGGPGSSSRSSGASSRSNSAKSQCAACDAACASSSSRAGGLNAFFTIDPGNLTAQAGGLDPRVPTCTNGVISCQGPRYTVLCGYPHCAHYPPPPTVAACDANGNPVCHAGYNTTGPVIGSATCYDRGPRSCCVDGKCQGSTGEMCGVPAGCPPGTTGYDSSSDCAASCKKSSSSSSKSSSSSTSSLNKCQQCIEDNCGDGSECKATECGDGIRAGAEECDGGSNCTQDCKKIPSSGGPRCGDGNLSASEECDDGNAQGGDCCSGSCTVEPGCTCTVSGTVSVCVPEGVCGDGNPDPDEECDDGNGDAGDGCYACAVEHPAPPSSASSSSAPPECSGFTCAMGAKSACLPDGCINLETQPCFECALPLCGNHELDPGEGCDDGGNKPGDGCDPSCIIEDDFCELIPASSSSVSSAAGAASSTLP